MPDDYYDGDGLTITLIQQGPAGPPGTGAGLTIEAGTTITANTVVVMVNGLLYPADITNLTHAPRVIGMAIETIDAFNNCTVQQTGELDGFEGLTVGQRYYVGASGVLSSSPSIEESTWQKYIGSAKTATSLILTLAPSVILAG